MQRVNCLPHDDNQPGWFLTSSSRVAQSAHSGQSTARFAVIGAGYTGLAAAHQLAVLFPDDEIILLEAQEVGFGTAGRNAGFAIDLPHDIGAKDYIGDIHVAQSTLKLNQLGQKLLVDWVQQYGIDCHMRHSGKYQGAVSDKGLKVLAAYQRGLDKLGAAYEVISGKDLPEHIGTDFYRQALYTPGTILLQPAALVKGLANHLPKNVSLYEHTAIEGYEYGKPIKLFHHNGCIQVDTLVLANNAFAMRFGFLQHTMLPMFLYASLTRPLTSAEQQTLGGQDFWGLIPADPYGSTVRRTHDQRILIRNSMSFNPNQQPKPHLLAKFKQHHQQSFRNRFAMLGEIPFEYTWSGSLALSQNHQGYFGQLAPNIYAAVCHNGLGITRGTATGYLLANWIAGQNNEYIEFLRQSSGPNRLPPEPFLSIGVNLTLWKGHYQAGLER